MDCRKIKKTTVILDFDGTMCRLFEGYELSKVSNRLHDEMNFINIAFSEDEDCFEVFRAITRQTHERDKLREQAYLIAHKIIMEAECEAVDTGLNVTGIIEFVNYLSQNEIRVGIATNNSEECVRKYLEKKGLSKGITIVGRQALHPEYMKPDSWSLTSVLKKMGSSFNETLFIGDSLNDFCCAQNCKVNFVGMASTDKKKKRLQSIEDNIDIVENYFDILRDFKSYGFICREQFSAI